jgi:septal ring factor EnvC (AmiA/AmiB activator)
MKILILIAGLSASLLFSADAKVLFDAKELAREILREEQQLKVDRGTYVPASSAATARNDSKLSEFDRRSADIKAKREKFGRLVAEFKLNEKEIWDAVAEKPAPKPALKGDESPEIKRASELMAEWKRMQETMPGHPATIEAGRMAREALEKARAAQKR